MTESFNKVKYIEECESKLAEKFAEIDQIAFFNQSKVCNAFAENRIAARHFAGTSGYGYGDDGRDKLSELFAAAAFLQGRSVQRRELFRRIFFRVRTHSPLRFSAFCAPAIRSFA